MINFSEIPTFQSKYRNSLEHNKTWAYAARAEVPGPPKSLAAWARRRLELVSRINGAQEKLSELGFP